MAVNVIRTTALAAIGAYIIRKLGAVMATQEQLLAEVSDLRDAYGAIAAYIAEQDNRIQNLRTQLEAAQANTPTEVDLSPLVDLVDEIQAHRQRLAPAIENTPLDGGALDQAPVDAEPASPADGEVETPAADEDSTDADTEEDQA